MKRSLARSIVFTLMISLISVGLITTSTYAWGPDGHEIVAMVAFHHLTPAAKAGVSKLLGNGDLEELMSAAAPFADDYRLSHHETKEWHFVDIPLDQSTYKESRDCKATP